MISGVLRNKTYPTRSFPEKFLYQRRIVKAREPIEEFVLTDKGKLVGEIVCQKSTAQWRDDYLGNCLIINFIKTTKQNKGYGKYLIDFAKNYSKQRGCNGYLLLKSDTSFTPHRIPHLFYRKQGFTTLEPKIDKKMDRFIKENKDAKHTDFKSMLMFYPSKETKNKNKFLEFTQKVLNYFKQD